MTVSPDGTIEFTGINGGVASLTYAIQQQGPTGGDAATVRFEVVATPLTAQDDDLGTVPVGQPASFNLYANDGDQPGEYEGGTGPAAGQDDVPACRGMEFNGITGEFSGTPAIAGTCAFYYQLANHIRARKASERSADRRRADRHVNVLNLDYDDHADDDHAHDILDVLDVGHDDVLERHVHDNPLRRSGSLGCCGIPNCRSSHAPETRHRTEKRPATFGGAGVPSFDGGGWRDSWMLVADFWRASVCVLRARSPFGRTDPLGRRCAAPRRVDRVAAGQDATATSEVNADPESVWRTRPGSRACRSASELGDDGGAVDPHLFSTDEAVAEVEHVEDAESDPATVAGDTEHLSDHGSGH